jgi:hypothetical protein
MIVGLSPSTATIADYRIFQYWIFRFIDLAHPMAGAGAVWVQQKEYIDVGDVLANARGRAGLSQQQLARLLRKPQSFVSNYERGQRRIDVLELIRVVDALKADAVEVFRSILVKRRPPGRPKR